MSYTAKTLVMTYKAAKQGMRIKTNNWTNPILTSEEWFKWFNKCLDEKISSNIKHYKNGRKWAYDYQIGLYRDSHNLNYYNNGSRLVIRYIETKELKDKFAHRIHRED